MQKQCVLFVGVIPFSWLCGVEWLMCSVSYLEETRSRSHASLPLHTDGLHDQTTPPTRPLPVNRQPEDMLGAQDASCLRYTAQEAKGPICHLCPNAQISVMRGLKSTWEPSPYRWRVCISHKLWQMMEHLQRLTGIKTVQSERLRECRCLLHFHLILIKHVWSAVRCIRRLFCSIKANTHGNKYRTTRNCLSVYI